MIIDIIVTSTGMAMGIIKQKKEKEKNQYVRRMLFFKQYPGLRDYDI